MSEHRYYEFQAIDRPLTAVQMTELIRASAKKDRSATRDRLVAAMAELVPSWDEMIRRAADRATEGP